MDSEATFSEKSRRQVSLSHQLIQREGNIVRACDISNTSDSYVECNTRNGNRSTGLQQNERCGQIEQQSDSCKRVQERDQGEERGEMRGQNPSAGHAQVKRVAVAVVKVVVKVVAEAEVEVEVMAVVVVDRVLELERVHVVKTEVLEPVHVALNSVVVVVEVGKVASKRVAEAESTFNM
ncbi:uncharacterized protein IUM83_19702 [Phytophthora cinnamomi]|uniref:uncharacterized protein n=1 Tax=Phytophthora cinnamomi TaxID=4785 RepID=UPI00355A95F4|nr:hypothetical protein IUM83_19702 [Phytophthora cinnamomi]